MQCLRCKSEKFGEGKSPGAPNWRAQVDCDRTRTRSLRAAFVPQRESPHRVDVGATNGYPDSTGSRSIVSCGKVRGGMGGAG